MVTGQIVTLVNVRLGLLFDCSYLYFSLKKTAGRKSQVQSIKMSSNNGLWCTEPFILLSLFRFKLGLSSRENLAYNLMLQQFFNN